MKEEPKESGGGGGGVGGTRFLRLCNPALCIKCGKYLARGRGAFWDAGWIMCVRCAKGLRGEAPLDPEEEDLLAWERAKAEEREGRAR